LQQLEGVASAVLLADELLGDPALAEVLEGYLTASTVELGA